MARSFANSNSNSAIRWSLQSGGIFWVVDVVSFINIEYTRITVRCLLSLRLFHWGFLTLDFWGLDVRIQDIVDMFSMRAEG
jgi:hypothetical protein